MTKKLKPLLAATVPDMGAVSFPRLASPKLDGIRCLIVDGEAVSRSLKPIPNRHIRDSLRGFPDFDGELIIGDPLAPDCFNVSTRGVMSQDGAPDFTLYAFDLWSHGGAFHSRLRAARKAAITLPFVHVVNHAAIRDLESLQEYESTVVGLGYEGAMIRDPLGVYKFGRSTVKEGILGKLKRFSDMEARVIGFEELQRNHNAQTKNALGYAERSSAKGGLAGGGTLGALVVEAKGFAESFKIGTGFTASQRAEIWASRDGLLGRLVKFKHQPAGTKDKPRFPSFIGFRGNE